MRKLTITDFSSLFPGYHVDRGGVSQYPPGQRSHPEGHHIHEVPEVFYLLQGHGELEVDGATHPVAAGDVLYIEPGEDHHLTGQSTLPLAYTWIHLHPTA